MKQIVELLSSPTNVLWSGLVSVIVSGLVTGLVSYALKNRETRAKVKIEYEYEQRRKHHELIGRYQGRLLSAANGLTYRQRNIYRNENRGWLKRVPDAGGDGYYFASTVYRFLCLFGLVHQIDSESIVLDPKIAKEADFSLLKYIAVLRWVMTDVSLFDGIGYDDATEKDHFFTDKFRHYAQHCLKDGELLSFDEFQSGPFIEKDIEPVVNFFDNLTRNEGRLRWDRLVALHLILMAFINRFGYDWQYSGQVHFTEVAKHFQNRQVLTNLVRWLNRHHLNRDKEAKKIMATLGQ